MTVHRAVQCRATDRHHRRPSRLVVLRTPSAYNLTVILPCRPTDRMIILPTGRVGSWCGPYTHPHPREGVGGGSDSRLLFFHEVFSELPVDRTNSVVIFCEVEELMITQAVSQPIFVATPWGIVRVHAKAGARWPGRRLLKRIATRVGAYLMKWGVRP